MIKDDTFTITDPIFEPSGSASFFERFIRDPRDIRFIYLSFLLLAIFPTMAFVLFNHSWFRWWMAPIYWAIYGKFLGPYTLMLHNTSHRVFFKKEYAVFNHVIPWLIGPFVGHAPGTYYAHHLGIHHADDNLPDDLSTTMPYQRDSFVDFMKYYLDFMVSYPKIIRYFLRTRRTKLLKMFCIGEIFFIALTIGALYYNWRAAFVVFVVPFFMTRFLLMAGNWTQHAFVDPDDPTDDYKTVISFINSPYNYECFNDGYHLGHHLKANRHWLDMPQDFLDKKQEMIEKQSLVFTKKDYFQIFILLMFKRYKTLAKYYVQLDPEHPLSEDEIIALFKRRLKKFTPEQLTKYSKEQASSTAQTKETVGS